MARKKEPSLVFNYPTKMIPTVLKLLMIAEPILIDVAPRIVIKIIADRVKQFAVVIIRKIDEIRDQIGSVVGATRIIPLVFAIPGHPAFIRVAVCASNSFLDEFRYLLD
jgi:hypothetical protein